MLHQNLIRSFCESFMDIRMVSLIRYLTVQIIMGLANTLKNWFLNDSKLQKKQLLRLWDGTHVRDWIL